MDASSEGHGKRKRRPVSKFGLALLTGYVATLLLAIFLPDHWHPPRDSEGPCRANLETLGEIFIARRTAAPDARPRSGPALFIEYRQDGDVPFGAEETLLCPGDHAGYFPCCAEDRELYDAFELDDPATWRDHISYAVRDFERFPIADGDEETSIIAADGCLKGGRSANHRDGIVVLYADGETDFVDWEDLGIEPPPEGVREFATAIVGPGSPNAELAKLIRPR